MKIKNSFKNRNLKFEKGFTLVELIVSVTITAILMVGMSAFFSSSFRNVFEAREKTSNLNSQFLTSLILQEKMTESQALEFLNENSAVLKNNIETGNLPFTYIGQNEKKIVFTDFFVFNGKAAGISSFIDVTNIKNPAGITKMADHYYVIAPLENAVYQCATLPGTCTTKLSLSGLKNPIGITNDGFNLFLTDAGHGRVLKISNVGTTNDITELATGLKFPTDIEYYLKDDGYLFISDTYDHRIKRINLVNNSIETVVGGGENADCSRTAKHCKLNFPIGLTLGNDGTEEGLYIADSGNGRILKVTDPKLDLSNYDFPLTLKNSSSIKRIDFIFPDDTKINSFKEGVGANTLHPGLYSFKDQTLTYGLQVPTSNNIFMEECEGEPPKCKNYFQGFMVDEANNIFKENDQISLGGKKFNVLYIDPLPGGVQIGVMPDDTIFSPPVPSTIQVENSYSGEHQFFLNLTDILFQPGFKNVVVQAYDLKNELVNEPTDRRVLQIGDGKLGSDEDVISVHQKGFDYLTDISWQDNQAVFSEQAQYTTDFGNFSYQTDFEVEDFTLSTKNNGSILEVYFKALLNVTADGEKKYEIYTLNSGLKK